jgi:hypothetical protein
MRMCTSPESTVRNEFTMSREPRPNDPAIICPVCTGEMREHGGDSRCNRCCYTMCSGCEYVEPDVGGIG